MWTLIKAVVFCGLLWTATKFVLDRTGSLEGKSQHQVEERVNRATH